MSRWIPVLLVVAAGCIAEQGPMMAPGEDCLECHGGGGGGGGAANALATAEGGEGDEDGKPWSVAGTIFASRTSEQGVRGVEIGITDANGWSFTIRSNQAGNFYTAEKPQFPLSVTLNGAPIHSVGTNEASCNSCHDSGNRVAAP
jgi:hypothetical protein